MQYIRFLAISILVSGFGCEASQPASGYPQAGTGGQAITAQSGAGGQQFVASGGIGGQQTAIQAGTGGQNAGTGGAGGTVVISGGTGGIRSVVDSSVAADSGVAVFDATTGDGATAGAGGTDVAVAGTGGEATGGEAGTTVTPDTVCSGSYDGTPGFTADLTLNGRSYTLHIGRSVTPTQPSPLVFSLHGLTMTPALMELMAGWDPVADREGIIIARPAGVGSMNGWDLMGDTDFDLMKAIIEDVDAKACVDRKRIYATGFSHGGFMSFSIACRLGDIFAAVAPCSGAGSAAFGCTARPVPVYAWHGSADGTVPYSSGESAVQAWVTHNGCTGSPVSFNVGTASCEHWDSCDADADIKFCTIPGGGHTYTRAATEEIWTFFKEHPLP